MSQYGRGQYKRKYVYGELTAKWPGSFFPSVTVEMRDSVKIRRVGKIAQVLSEWALRTYGHKIKFLVYHMYQGHTYILLLALCWVSCHHNLWLYCSKVCVSTAKSCDLQRGQLLKRSTRSMEMWMFAEHLCDHCSKWVSQL